MSNLRLKLDFSRLAGWRHQLRSKFWLLVKSGTCDTIEDLKVLIRQKFDLDEQTQPQDFEILLQDAIIPEHELISILNSDDCLSLVGEKIPKFSSPPVEPDATPIKRRKSKRKKKRHDQKEPVIVASPPSSFSEEEKADEPIVSSPIVKPHAVRRLSKERRRPKVTTPIESSEEEVEPHKETVQVTKEQRVSAVGPSNAVVKPVAPVPDPVISPTPASVDAANCPAKRKRRKRSKKKSADQSPVIDAAPIAKPTRRPDVVVQKATTRVNGFNSGGKHVRFGSPGPDDDVQQSGEVASFGANGSSAGTREPDLSSRLRSLAKSPAVETTPQRGAVQSKNSNTTTKDQPTPVSEKPKLYKDFSLYSALVGPPRIGDTIAYKVLELSESYTPEISDFKVGRVISFDPGTGQVNVEYLQPLSVKVKRGKFELLSDEELEERKRNEDEWDGFELVEPPDKFETVTNDHVALAAMIDAKLVVD